MISYLGTYFCSFSEKLNIIQAFLIDWFFITTFHQISTKTLEQERNSQTHATMRERTWKVFFPHDTMMKFSFPSFYPHFQFFLRLPRENIGKFSNKKNVSSLKLEIFKIFLQFSFSLILILFHWKFFVADRISSFSWEKSSWKVKIENSKMIPKVWKLKSSYLKVVLWLD